MSSPARPETSRPPGSRSDGSGGSRASAGARHGHRHRRGWRGSRVGGRDRVRALADPSQVRHLVQHVEPEWRPHRDGEQALQTLQSAELPDLVLSDVMLPKLDGTELLALARRRFPTASLPFVLLSAGLDPGVRETDACFIAKPLDLDQLLERVESIVGARYPITTP